MLWYYGSVGESVLGQFTGVNRGCRGVWRSFSCFPFVQFFFAVVFSIISYCSTAWVPPDTRNRLHFDTPTSTHPLLTINLLYNTITMLYNFLVFFSGWISLHRTSGAAVETRQLLSSLNLTMSYHLSDCSIASLLLLLVEVYSRDEHQSSFAVATMSDIKLNFCLAYFEQDSDRSSSIFSHDCLSCHLLLLTWNIHAVVSIHR